MSSQKPRTEPHNAATSPAVHTPTPPSEIPSQDVVAMASLDSSSADDDLEENSGDEIELIGFKAAGTLTPSRTYRCTGYKLDIPEGKSPHTAYPFGLHESQNLPYDYAVRGGDMFLTSRKCREYVNEEGGICRGCAVLSLNPMVRGIVDRMNNGTHINTAHAYRGFDELYAALKRHADQNQFLRFHALTQARSIIRKTAKISDHDRLLVAISSEDVARVDRVIHVALKQKRGVVGVLEQVMAAARGAYNVKSFTEQERLLGRLLWRLGGDRVGHIVHRALGLPGVNTLRGGSVKMPIIPCAGAPTSDIVARNTRIVLEGVVEVLKELNQAGVLHIVLMFDELACEKRLRYCTHTGEVLGLCRQHGPRVALKLDNMGDVEEIYKALDEGEVHYAADVSDVAVFVLIDS